jgi:uncharacterized protein
MALPPRQYDGFLPGRHPVTGFGQHGFRFAEMSHTGSILILPSGVYRWEPPVPFRHDEALYGAVFAEASTIDVFLVGSGTVPLPMPETLRWLFRDRRMSVDVMTTGAAASTFNVLLSENRRVAAALVAVV